MVASDEIRPSVPSSIALLEIDEAYPSGSVLIYVSTL
jgi:hypothetical protein